MIVQIPQTYLQHDRPLPNLSGEPGIESHEDSSFVR